MKMQDFDKILDMKSEVAMLEKRLNKLKKSEIVTDYAKDYKSGYGRVIAITGYEIQNAEKINKISNLLEKRKDRLELILLEAELFIDSIPDTYSRIRTFMTQRYLEGMEWNEVSKAFYKKMKSNSAQMAVSRYFDKLQKL